MAQTSKAQQSAQKSAQQQTKHAHVKHDKVKHDEIEHSWIKHSPYSLVGGITPTENKSISNQKAIATLFPTRFLDQANFCPIEHWQKSEVSYLLNRIHDAKIVGMGGAAFPTDIKLSSNHSGLKTLIVNAMECEPYISCDDRLLREHSYGILQGALIAAKIISANRILFGIEDNKPEALGALVQQIEIYKNQLFASGFNNDSKKNNGEKPLIIEVIIAKTRYPSGGEKQVIQLLTGGQVPQNHYPPAIGILVHNVATLFAIYEAVIHGYPLTRRLVTITGDRVPEAGNYWLNFGTSLADIVTQLNIDTNDLSTIIIGGPLMGNSVSDLSITSQPSTNCLIFDSSPLSGRSKASNFAHSACIRCAECSMVCPVSLLPQQLYWFAHSEQWARLEEQNLFDCIECGACDYVCPSEIPLVSYYRFAKSEIRHIGAKKQRSDKAKQRFENRENRLIKIKTEREEKRRKTALARKLASRNKNQDPDGKKTAIAAALKRVKDKKDTQL